MNDLVTGPVERLATGMRFTEGPVWLHDHGCLLFTDIPANRILRWSADRGIETWAANAHFAIGLARDRQGRVLACEHATRSLAALQVGPDGAMGERAVLAAGWEGQVLNSTNDVICTGDGTILFTDPPFGVRDLDGALHGYQQAQEIAGCHVFAVGPTPQTPRVVVAGIWRPNGLCLSPDERVLYVSDSSERFHKIVALDYAGGQAGGLRDFAVMPVGVPDGMRVDAEGRLWVAGGDGVHVWDAQGRAVTHVPVPEMVTNIAFGGPAMSDLYITATTSLYRVPTATRCGRD